MQAWRLCGMSCASTPALIWLPFKQRTVSCGAAQKRAQPCICTRRATPCTVACVCTCARVRAGKDPYATVRIINYLRHVANSAAAAGGNVVAAVTSATAPAALSAAMASWTDETWLRPELEDDAVLMAALEAVDLDDEETEAEAEGSAVAAAGAAATASRPSADASAVPANLEQAKAMIAELQRQLGVANRMLHACTAGDASDSDDAAAGSDSDTDSDADASRANRAAHAARRAQAAVKGVAAPAGAAPSDVPAQDNDTYYFDSYAGVDIHCDMLSDAVRTDAYRDALKRNPHRYAGKQVLDVGCGTGILSMFAAQAGAAHVIALDASAIIEEATVIVAANGLSDRVRPVRGKAEEVDLPRYLPAAADGKVDIIVSEWMGYALLYECMLNSYVSPPPRGLCAMRCMQCATHHAAYRVARVLCAPV
ncbi:class I SAM-dependent methyltransferase [archaeon]|nr:MAG: class I SAM-dependent methyltransferase [archaeon]